MGWLDGKVVTDMGFGNQADWDDASKTIDINNHTWKSMVKKCYRGDTLIYERVSWIEQDLVNLVDLIGSGGYYDTNIQLSSEWTIGSSVCHGWGIDFCLNDTDIIHTVETGAVAIRKIAFFGSGRNGRDGYIEMYYNSSNSTYSGVPSGYCKIYINFVSGSGSPEEILFNLTLGKTYSIKYTYNDIKLLVIDEDGNTIHENNRLYIPSTISNDATGIIFGNVNDRNDKTVRTAGTLDLFRFYRLVDKT